MRWRIGAFPQTPVVIPNEAGHTPFTRLTVLTEAFKEWTTDIKHYLPQGEAASRYRRELTAKEGTYAPQSLDTDAVRVEGGSAIDLIANIVKACFALRPSGKRRDGREGDPSEVAAQIWPKETQDRYQAYGCYEVQR